MPSILIYANACLTIFGNTQTRSYGFIALDFIVLLFFNFFNTFFFKFSTYRPKNSLYKLAIMSKDTPRVEGIQEIFQLSFFFSKKHAEVSTKKQKTIENVISRTISYLFFAGMSLLADAVSLRQTSEIRSP